MGEQMPPLPPPPMTSLEQIGLNSIQMFIDEVYSLVCG